MPRNYGSRTRHDTNRFLQELENLSENTFLPTTMCVSRLGVVRERLYYLVACLRDMGHLIENVSDGRVSGYMIDREPWQAKRAARGRLVPITTRVSRTKPFIAYYAQSLREDLGPHLMRQANVAHGWLVDLRDLLANGDDVDLADYAIVIAAEIDASRRAS